MDCVANQFNSPRLAFTVVWPVCGHCDETDLSGVTLLINCDGLVCCLSNSATTLIKFVLFPFAPLVETFHLIHHTFELWIVSCTADHT